MRGSYRDRSHFISLSPIEDPRLIYDERLYKYPVACKPEIAGKAITKALKNSSVEIKATWPQSTHHPDSGTTMNLWGAIERLQNEDWEPPDRQWHSSRDGNIEKDRQYSHLLVMGKGKDVKEFLEKIKKYNPEYCPISTRVECSGFESNYFR